MRQVAKYVCPVFVVLGLLIFHANDSRYVWPIACELIALGIIFLSCKYLREKPQSEGLMLFWFAPLALLWLLSERREGRDVSPISIGIEIALAGIGTAILLTTNSLRKEEGRLIFAILLSWAVGYFSGQSGGADKMHPMFSIFGLTGDDLVRVVIWVRKIIHITFYGTLMALFATYLWREIANKRNVIFYSIAFPLCISICDEFRQSMMPNRGGSYLDVILDMTSASIVLFFVFHRQKKKTLVTE